jgi:hypothetical protein
MVTEITFFSVIRGVFRGGSEIFLGIKHFHVKRHSNENNVWVTEQNTQFETELQQEILYQFLRDLQEIFNIILSLFYRESYNAIILSLI